jgi:hypothetical protein
MYESLWDSSNPFNRDGLSLEVRHILKYLEDAKRATGVDVVVTSTTDHPLYSSSGRVSRHRQQGTDGLGLALDCRMRTRGDYKHKAVFDLFVPVEKRISELIYAGSTYNIKYGVRVAPYAVSDHKDHVHIGVNRGVLLTYPDQITTWSWEGEELPKPLDITSAADCPTGGYWKQSAEGGIYAYGGAPDYGAYNRFPQLFPAAGSPPRLFASLIATPGGGYIQFATDGAFYHWGP